MSSMETTGHIAMSDVLLQEWVKAVEVENSNKITESPVLAILSDGWSCVSGNSHIQFLVSTPEPVFVKSVHQRTAQYLH